MLFKKLSILKNYTFVLKCQSQPYEDTVRKHLSASFKGWFHPEPIWLAPNLGFAASRMLENTFLLIKKKKNH